MNSNENATYDKILGIFVGDGDVNDGNSEEKIKNVYKNSCIAF